MQIRIILNKGEYMEDSVVKRLALVLAIQAEIEGMKVENLEREFRGESLAYGEDAFLIAAEDLRSLAENDKL